MCIFFSSNLLHKLSVLIFNFCKLSFMLNYIFNTFLFFNSCKKFIIIFYEIDLKMKGNISQARINQ